MRSKNTIRFRAIILAALLTSLFVATATRAQTPIQPDNVPATPDGAAFQPTSFTYQGRLTETGMTGGTYDFQFALYNAGAGGTAIGTEILAGVTVTNGVFTVELDFGEAAFPDEERYLEIRVKRPTDADYTVLNPRQKLTSAPFAIRSKTAATAATANNALAVGGTLAANIIKEGDARLTDSRQPSAGSGNYVQNTTTQQASTNFNVSGSGTANVFNAATQFNIGGSRVLSVAGSNNLFVGADAGTGATNTGGFNSFVGRDAGLQNTTGSSNLFAGTFAGRSNTTGGGNAFVGAFAGQNNTTGEGNSFFGTSTGATNTTGSNNTLVGYNVLLPSESALNFAAAFGSHAQATASDTIVLGKVAGNYFNPATGMNEARPADTVRIPGNLNLSGTFTGNFTVPAANVTGTLAAAQIPNLAASYVQNSTTQQTGNFNLSGGGTLGGALAANSVGIGAGGLNVNDNLLRLRTSGDNNHGVLYSTTVDGPEFRAFGGFRWTNGLGGATERMKLDAAGVLTVGTVNAATQFNIGGSRVLSIAGTSNLFVGANAGGTMNTGSSNSFVGTSAGEKNTSGNFNSFFGLGAGGDNTEGTANTFIGAESGAINQAGSNNTFIGAAAGDSNTSGSNNTFIGSGADASAGNLTYITVIGAGATGNSNNSIFLGRSSDRVVVPSGRVSLQLLVGNGNISLCFNTSVAEIAGCSSSLRYKTNIAPFNFGLNLVNRLRPVTFDWKADGMHDLGLVAEEVAAIEPLLATYNKDGQIEGVKYDRIGVVLLNAVKEQQTQIEEQNSQIKTQQKQISELKQIVCALKPEAAVCQ